MTRQRAILVGLVGLSFVFTLLVGWARWELVFMGDWVS